MNTSELETLIRTILSEQLTPGQTPDQPGPARKIADQLERVQRNIDKAEARLS